MPNMPKRVPGTLTEVEVVAAEDVDLEAAQLLEDDVVRLEVKHPEVARYPPHSEVLAVVDHVQRCSASGGD